VAEGWGRLVPVYHTLGNNGDIQGIRDKWGCAVCTSSLLLFFFFLPPFLSMLGGPKHCVCRAWIIKRLTLVLYIYRKKRRVIKSRRVICASAASAVRGEPNSLALFSPRVTRLNLQF